MLVQMDSIASTSSYCLHDLLLSISIVKGAVESIYVLLIILHVCGYSHTNHIMSLKFVSAFTACIVGKLVLYYKCQYCIDLQVGGKGAERAWDNLGHTHRVCDSPIIDHRTVHTYSPPLQV